METIGKYITGYIKGKIPKNLFDSQQTGLLPYLSPDYLRGKTEPEQYCEYKDNAILVDNGDVVILWDGSNAGEVLISKRGILASTMTKIEFDEGCLDKKYFGYAFQNLEYILKAKTAGSGIPHADKGIIKRLEFYRPLKNEQIAIANILSKVDEAIASVKNSIAAAERLKKSLMQNLLTGKMKPDGTFRTPEEFYIDEKFGKVPIGWEVKKLQELSIQITDGEHQTPERADEGYYLLSARNIKNGYLSLEDVDYIPETELLRIQKRCNPQVGDILISCSGTIGNVCLVPEGFIGGMVRSAALVKIKKDMIEPQFAELMLQSYFLQNQMKVAVASSVQGNIFQGAIRRLRMYYPNDKKERNTIIECLCRFNTKISSKQQQIVILERLKKSLMQNLLTGKVRTKNG
jgi:type I restriction enzyme S subunit